MLISLHLPKTAGSSFFTALKDHYRDSILRDYTDLPINTSRFNRNSHALKMFFFYALKPPKNVECIHGHFLPLKYLSSRNATFVTWIRDPIERLASHYFHWMRNRNRENAPPLHRRVIEEEWSLERFCLSPELKNFYSQFLWGFPVGRFDFIGITEYYETELDYFARRFLGTTVQCYEKNRNPKKKSRDYFEDKQLKRQVELFHSKDIALYEHALKVRLRSRST